MSQIINWLEIPVRDVDRAADFYSTVLDYETEIGVHNDLNAPIATIVSDEQTVSALLLPADAEEKGDTFAPSDSGPRVYFAIDSERELDESISTVEPAGGEILLPKTNKGHIYFSIIKDTEGNRVGLLFAE